MRSHIKRRAYVRVAGARDMPGVVALTRLEAPRCEPEVRCDRSRRLEAVWIIHGSLVRQRTRSTPGADMSSLQTGSALTRALTAVSSQVGLVEQCPGVEQRLERA